MSASGRVRSARSGVREAQPLEDFASQTAERIGGAGARRVTEDGLADAGCLLQRTAGGDLGVEDPLAVLGAQPFLQRDWRRLARPS